jgi:hypothetical protein
MDNSDDGKAYPEWLSVSWLLTAGLKKVWGFVEEHHFGLSMGAIAAAIIYGCFLAVQYKALDDYKNYAINPIYLEVNHVRAHREWVLDCVRGATGGWPGSGTATQGVVEGCTATGKELYPDKDWVEIARRNHKPEMDARLSN